MTYKICYWDDFIGAQEERDATPEEVAEIESRRAQSNPIPQVVTMKQARLALFQSGYLAQIQPAIDALDDPTKTEAQIEWDHSTTVERNNEFCMLLGSSIGLTETQIDDLFRLAITL